MPGLHECPVCHYRFETADDLEAHISDRGCQEQEAWEEQERRATYGMVRRLLLGEPEPKQEARHRAG